MDLHIPDWIITWSFYAVTGSVFGIILFLGLLAYGRIIYKAVKDQNDYWWLSLWFFSRQYRKKADAFTDSVLKTVADKIRAENPKRYSQLIAHFRFYELNDKTEQIVEALEEFYKLPPEDQKRSDLYSVVHEVLLKPAK